MAQPTIATRRARRFILCSSDRAIEDLLRRSLPESWEMVQTTAPGELGDYAELLQHRFLLLDLDDSGFDALDIIDTLRRDLMLNIAIICFGGAPALRDAARLARADRFFERSAAVEVMQQFCSQYDW